MLESVLKTCQIHFVIKVCNIHLDLILTHQCLISADSHLDKCVYVHGSPLPLHFHGKINNKLKPYCD